jgi:mannose-6-phosphate isomerase-like protein (cupin superfamily)
MDLIAVELSNDALRNIGRVLTPRERPLVFVGEECRYDQTVNDIGLVGPLSSGSLECAPRPKILKKMECHRKTVEMLVALDGDAVVCVAPPQEPTDGVLKGLTAVRVRVGESFVMEKGAWHWIPYPTNAQTVRFLVVFRNATGDDDMQFVNLSEPMTVR